MNACSVTICHRPVLAKTLCGTHYQRLQRYGRLYRVTRKRLSREKVPSLPYMHRKRFGGLREAVLERDGYCCVECGMTREEHRDRWGRDLTIDHIDGEGRNSEEPNNEMNNLRTLCLSDHTRIERLS